MAHRASVLIILIVAAAAHAADSVHTTYLWHLHQPIYWPDQRRGAGAEDRYENAWDSIQQTDGGAAHPANNLREIFGKADRVAVYQWRVRDSVQTILGRPDAGVQLNYSGALMENVASLGFAGQLGYSGGWKDAINEARGWTTSGGHSRVDVVNFNYQHAMLPLLSRRTQWLQIRLQQEQMQRNWGIAPGAARGFFPAETCFTRRLIPVLADLGVEWSFVSNEHISRACPDFPLQLGTGGVNCDPPNRADQINPPGVNWWRKSISRGCSPVNAYPFAYQPHRAQYVDPATGDVSEIIVVPTDQALSWDDGYNPIGADALDTIAAGNDPARPMLVVFAHDGDNAWGGGFSYYMEAVQNFVNDAAGRGYRPSTVNQYLADHPVPADALIHVEDGGWVNADSDFGSPIFINWLYPLISAGGDPDPINGWHYKAREYAIFTAAENRIRTAENLAGGPGTTRIDHVLDPRSATARVERAWSYYLASMDSGNVYYGNPLDMEVKGTVGCNEAMEHVDPILAAMAPAEDLTEPTVFIPQRHPYNPGSVSFGAQYGYQQYINDGSFVVWTFAYDVGGIAQATLNYRVDVDGVNPLDSIQNETYAGGAEVGAWQSLPMNGRAFPADNIYGWGGLDYFEMPAHIAEHYSATVPALNEKLLDYYVEVVDARGNVARTDIQHVWIGDGSGATGDTVLIDPRPPVRGAALNVTYDPAGRPLDGAGQVYIHLGFDGWQDPVEHLAMTDAGDGTWTHTLTVPAGAGQVDLAFNDEPTGSAGTWDNNGGADWHFTTTDSPTTPTASFTATPRSGPAPLTVQFSSTSGGAPTSYAWDLDGDTELDDSAANPAWEYATPGTYTVTLTVANAQGSDTRTEVDYISVSAPPTDPLIELSRASLAADAAPGFDAADQTFTVRNAGGGELRYDVAVSYAHGGIHWPDIAAWLLGLTADPTGMDLNGDGVVDIGDVAWAVNADVGGWLSVAPTGGTSSGEADTFTVSFDSAALGEGSYTARIDVLGQAANSPQSIDVTLEIGSPTETTVVPNPPTAGQGVRVWYASSGGPLAGAATIVLHWGVNGWDPANITDTPMTDGGAGMWYADIVLPIDATMLDFVVNDGAGNWDNNGGADWHFAVEPWTPTEPLLQLSTTQLTQSAVEGVTPAALAFEIANAGAGTLDYTIQPVDTGGGTDWFAVSPLAGNATAETDTIDVSFTSATLAPGVYAAQLRVAANAPNAPQTIDLTLTVNAEPPASPITIGPGPQLGTTTNGDTFNEQFQDWQAADVRVLDPPFDGVDLGDGANDARDLVAFYSRLEAGNLYLRADLFDLAVGSENGSVDLYVLIDCAPGGATGLPNGIGGSTAREWDVAVATYDAINHAVLDSSFAPIAGAHLGAYWRADLDAVEFGVKQSALTAAGWDGSSTLYVNVFTAKDFGNQVTDTFDLGSAVPGDASPGRAKLASIAHGNQSLNRGDSIRERIFIDGLQTGTGAPSGFRLTLDTHRLFQIPLNIHMSGTLIAAIGWIEDANPVWNGADFLGAVGAIVDADQNDQPGALIGGVFAEHIMPFFNGPVNLNSIEHFDALAQTVWGLTPADMRVMHTPERVINSVAPGNGADPFDDIVASDYSATYLDEVAHIRDWLYPGDPWTGLYGEYGVARQHKIHRINGVDCFQINDNEDQYKFFPQDGGAHRLWRANLLYKALDSDQAQLTLIFDDWEALAGWSFGSGYNDNALNYHTVMRWVANHPWIEVVNLKDILDRATNPAHPRYDAGWIVDHGEIGDKPFNTYDYLHHATQDSYANWYNGSGLEESFRDAIPVVDGQILAGTPIPSGKRFGALDLPGTLIYDSWAAVGAAPQNSLRELAELAYHSMIYETAWHDEDNTNYDRNPATGYNSWQYPDTTYDRVSGWAFTLHSHVRGVTIVTAAAAWADALEQGTRPPGVSVDAADLDQDGQNEYVLANERVWMAFEARGGRCVQAYHYDPATRDAWSFLGSSPINNPSAQGEEEGNALASRCSGFKEVNGDAYADVIYGVATGPDALTFTSPDTLITKRIALAAGSNVIDAQYTNNLGEDLYVRMGVSVNNLDLLVNGANFTSTHSASRYRQTNATRGRLTIDATANSSINELDAFTRRVIPLTEQMEVRIGSGSAAFTLTAE